VFPFVSSDVTPNWITESSGHNTFTDEIVVRSTG